MLSFLPLKNNSVTIGLNFSLAYISAIISSNTTKTFLCWIIVITFHSHNQLFVHDQ